MSEGNHVLYLDHDGLRRRYVLHQPPGAPPSSGWPVVMMLDGRGGTPWTAIKSTGWTGQADARGFLAVFPEAIRVNPNGPQHFLDNPQLWRMDRAPLDDLGFLAAGGSQPPLETLRKAGVDMEDPETVEECLRTFEETLAQLEKLMEE